jgi:hypothetical protein
LNCVIRSPAARRHGYLVADVRLVSCCVPKALMAGKSQAKTQGRVDKSDPVASRHR